MSLRQSAAQAAAHTTTTGETGKSRMSSLFVCLLARSLAHSLARSIARSLATSHERLMVDNTQDSPVATTGGFVRVSRLTPSLLARLLAAGDDWHLAVGVRHLNVALTNSGVGVARMSASYGRASGEADAWPIRCRNGCRPSSTCTGCTRDRANSSRRSCGTSSRRCEFAAARTASYPWTLSCSVGDTPAAAAGTV